METIQDDGREYVQYSEITVYGLPNCQACNQTVALMTDYGLDFEEIEIDETNSQEFIDLGFSQAPVVHVVSEYVDVWWCGFQELKIRELFEQELNASFKPNNIPEFAVWDF